MKYSAAALLLLVSFYAKAQERSGISNSNYAGVNGTWLNPSSMVDSRVFLDIHLAGAGVFAHNNYAYLPNSRIYDIRKVTDWNQVQFRTHDRDKNGFVDAQIMGPAAMLSVGKNAFGFHTGVRSYTHANGIPDELLDIWRDGYTWKPEYEGTHRWNRVSLKQLTWGEAAFSYARILKQQGPHMFQGGLTVKRLWGINSTNFSAERFNFTVVDSANVNLNQFTGNYAYVTQPGWAKGKGWGADLGFTYKRALNGNSYEGYTPNIKSYKCDYIDYKYKIGFSIVDFGRINFNQDAIYRTFDRDFDEDDNTQSVELEEGMSAQAAADEIFSQGNSSTSGTAFKAWLPTMISGQFDYNFENNIYLNATLVQRWGRSKMNGVHRPNVLSITPRYERRNFEVSMPVSLYEYRYPMVGLALRFNGIIIGTDNLGPFLFKKDLLRSDIYVHAKISLFRNCNERTPDARPSALPKKRTGLGGRPKRVKPKRKRGKNKLTLCPEFD